MNTAKSIKWKCVIHSHAISTRKTINWLSAGMAEHWFLEKFISPQRGTNNISSENSHTEKAYSKFVFQHFEIYSVESIHPTYCTANSGNEHFQKLIGWTLPYSIIILTFMSYKTQSTGKQYIDRKGEIRLILADTLFWFLLSYQHH